MKMTKITSPTEPTVPAVHRFSDKQFYDEINYYRTEKIVKKMLDKGLITDDEFDRIMVEARKIFVPLLVKIL